MEPNIGLLSMGLPFLAIAAAGRVFGHRLVADLDRTGDKGLRSLRHISAATKVRWEVVLLLVLGVVVVAASFAVGR